MDIETIGIITAIVVTVATGASFVISRVYKLGKVSNRLDTLSKDMADIKTEIKDSSRDITKRIDDLIMAYSQRGLSESNSPRQLTEEGLKVLKSSAIDAVVDDKFDLIVERVKELSPEYSYQAEQAVLAVVRELVDDASLKDAIEEGAFNSGYLVSSVLFAGGLYIRDRVLSELGFKSEEIDTHKPKA